MYRGQSSAQGRYARLDDHRAESQSVRPRGRAASSSHSGSPRKSIAGNVKPQRAATGGVDTQRSASRNSSRSRGYRKDITPGSVRSRGSVDDAVYPFRAGHTPSQASASSSSSSASASLFDGSSRSYESSSSVNEWTEERDLKSMEDEHAASEEKQALNGGANTSRAYGVAIWNRVTSLAENLSINVSKAWDSNLEPADGEATPTGQDSRLIKAMKSYHLKNARSAKELPAWLFSDKERLVRDHTSTRGEPSRHDDRIDDTAQSEQSRPSRPSGLRGVFDQVNSASRGSSMSQEGRSGGRYRHEERDDHSGPSPGSTRTQERQPAGYRQRESEGQHDHAPRRIVPKHTNGLPSRPRR